MHVAINIESNRLQAATVDLDGNVLVYKIGEGLNSLKTEIPCNIYIKGINAYVGDIIDIIKYEDPNIKNVENFVLNLSNSDFIYEDDSNRKWTALYLLSLVLSKLKKDIEINTMQTIKSCSIGVSPLYNEINILDLETAYLYNRLKLQKTYRHFSCASLYLIHKYQLKQTTSIIYFYGDWDYIQMGIGQISDKEINQLSSPSIKIESINGVKPFLIDFIKKCYQDQVGDPIVLHASNLVVINKIINTVIDKFYFRNEDLYENTIIINNNIVSININKTDLDEINDTFRNRIIESYNTLMNAYNQPEAVFDYFIFTGRLGSIFFFREIFEKLENPVWKEKVFSAKNDILVKGLALFDFEPYKHLKISDTHENKLGSKLKLNISSMGFEKSYDITSLSKHLDQSVCINNVLEDGMINSLSSDECEIEIVEYCNADSTKIGDLKLELPFEYSLNHFQLSCNIDDRGKLSFKARDVFNDLDIKTHFTQESKPKRTDHQTKPKKELIKPKIQIGSNKRIRILSKNGNDINQVELAQKTLPKKIKIGQNEEENHEQKLKITITKSDLKERQKPIINNDKISKNENTIVEDFHELIRIIVINNSP